MAATENAYITIYHISMRLRIEVLIDLKLEKLAPFSQLSARVRVSPVVLWKAFGCRAVGIDATENAYYNTTHPPIENMYTVVLRILNVHHASRLPTIYV